MAVTALDGQKGATTLGHYIEKILKWQHFGGRSVILHSSKQKLNHILLQCNWWLNSQSFAVWLFVAAACSFSVKHSCLTGFISNIVKMPLTQCHFSHWHTESALFLSHSPHYSCSFCHVTISKKQNFSSAELLTQCYIRVLKFLKCENEVNVAQKTWDPSFSQT